MCSELFTNVDDKYKSVVETTTILNLNSLETYLLTLAIIVTAWVPNPKSLAFKSIKFAPFWETCSVSFPFIFKYNLISSVIPVSMLYVNLISSVIP